MSRSVYLIGTLPSITVRYLVSEETCCAPCGCRATTSFTKPGLTKRTTRKATSSKDVSKSSVNTISDLRDISTLQYTPFPPFSHSACALNPTQTEHHQESHLTLSMSKRTGTTASSGSPSDSSIVSEPGNYSYAYEDSELDC